VLGANHVSFLDDVAGCGLKCRFCQKSTVSDETVNALAKAYVVAFLEYHVRGIAGYATYLTGERART
jgi:wobble nucleotide-excising tRNase